MMHGGMRTVICKKIMMRLLTLILTNNKNKNEEMEIILKLLKF